MDAHPAAERLVGVIVAVDGRDLGQSLEVLGCLFVGGLQVLAMAAPWGVESNKEYIYKKLERFSGEKGSECLLYNLLREELASLINKIVQLLSSPKYGSN